MEDNNNEVLKQHIRTLDMFQYAVKIIINQFYGAFGNPYFYFRNKDIAESITMQGRDLIKYSIDVLNNYFTNRWHLDTTLHQQLGISDKKINKIDDNVVIYVDTDSNYVNFKILLDSIEGLNLKGRPAIQFVLDVINNRIAKYLENAFKVYADQYQTDNRMVFKLENISDCGIWVAKKCYVLRINYQDFYRDPKVKAKGLPCTKPSYPKVARDIQWKIIDKLLDLNHNIVQEKDIIPILKEYYEKFKSYNMDEISFNYYVNGLEKYVISKDDYYIEEKIVSLNQEDLYSSPLPLDKMSKTKIIKYAINKTTGLYHTMETPKKGVFNAEITDETQTYYLVKGVANKVKGAIYFNDFINMTNNTKYNKIRSGDKIKFYYAEGNKSFCYPPSQHTTELSIPIDYKEHFFKCVVTPINSLLEALGKQPLDEELKRYIKLVMPKPKKEENIFPFYCVNSETLENYEIPDKYGKYIVTNKEIPEYLIEEYDTLVNKFGTDLVIMSHLSLEKYIKARTKAMNTKMNKELMDMFTDIQLKHYKDALAFLKKKYKFKVDYDEQTKETVLFITKSQKRFILSTEIIRRMKCVENYISTVTDYFEEELGLDSDDED